MNSENPPKIERIGKNREKLLALEKEGRYVFHGSPDVIQILEPRQAENMNQETGKMEKDGNPAVHATPFADVAIFRALVNDRDVIGDSTSEWDARLNFSATKNLLEKAKEKVGKVYVLDKSKFKDFIGWDCRSEETVVPAKVIEVTADDLPPDIQITHNHLSI